MIRDHKGTPRLQHMLHCHKDIGTVNEKTRRNQNGATFNQKKMIQFHETGESVSLCGTSQSFQTCTFVKKWMLSVLNRQASQQTNKEKLRWRNVVEANYETCPVFDVHDYCLMYAFLYTHTNTHIHARAYAHTQTHTYTHTHVRVH